MKKIAFIFTCIVSFFIINGFVHSIVNLWQKQRLIVEAQQELQIKQKENKSLQVQLHTVKTDTFVEEQARDKLFLSKPGESVVIVPQDLLSPTPLPQAHEVQESSNWSKWMKLLLTPSS